MKYQRTTVYLVEGEWDDYEGCSWIAAAYFSRRRADRAVVAFQDQRREDHQRRDSMGNDVVYRVVPIKAYGKAAGKKPATPLGERRAA